MAKKQAKDILPCRGCPGRRKCAKKMLARMPSDEWHKHFGQLECGKLREWLGRHCSAHSSVKTILVPDLDELEDQIVGTVRGGRLLDRHEERLDGRSIHRRKQRAYCWECVHWRKPRYCKWLDGDVRGSRRADGCAGYKPTV